MLLAPPPLTARVTDTAGALSAGDRARIEAKLQSYEARTGHQVAVLIVGSLAGDTIEAFSLRAAEQWRLGDSKRDDGLLFVVALADRRMRVEVGYGLEGAIPDVVAARVIQDIVAPRFREGDTAGGVEAGLDALMRAGEGEAVGPAPSTSPSTSESGDTSGFGALFVFLLFIGVFIAKLPLLLRLPGGAVIGGLAGIALFHSTMMMIVGAIGGAILFTLLGGGGGGGGRGRRGRGPVFLPIPMGRSSSSSWGGGGGFSGGGGGFGGGGASGSW